MLNRLIQPSQNFHITIREIAKLLNIPLKIILRIELWAYVIFVHRSDRGGQFVSYRKLQKWRYAVACQIQKHTTKKDLRKLWLEIVSDGKKYAKQYQASYYNFVQKILNQQWQKLSKEGVLQKLAS